MLIKISSPHQYDKIKHKHNQIYDIKSLEKKGIHKI